MCKNHRKSSKMKHPTSKVQFISNTQGDNMKWKEHVQGKNGVISALIQGSTSLEG